MCKDVSVIMPNYNCIEYIEKAINSVLIQKNVLFELIIIDDGSTDGSTEFLIDMQKKHKEIKLIRQCNKGVIYARNKAIKKSNSKYIAFLDADDFWLPNKLEKQINYMKKNPNCGLSFTNYEHIDMNYKNIIDCFSYWEEISDYITGNKNYRELQDPVNFILSANIIGTSSVVVKKDVIERAGGFDPTLKSASDWDCWLRVALLSDVAFTEEITMNYLMRPNSITSNKIKRIQAMEDITNRIGSLSIIKKSSKNKAFSRILDSYSEMYRENKQFFNSFKYSLKAFKTNPHKRHLKHLFFDIKEILKILFLYNIVFKTE